MAYLILHLPDTIIYLWGVLSHLMSVFYTLIDASATACFRRLPAVLCKRVESSKLILLVLPVLVAFQRVTVPTFTWVAPTKSVSVSGARARWLSEPCNGWNRTNALTPSQRLKMFFHPSFQAAIDSGVQNITPNSGEMNGKAIFSSEVIPTELLGKQTGFRGVAVTGWKAITRLVRLRKVTATENGTIWMTSEGFMTLCTTSICRNV